MKTASAKIVLLLSLSGSLIAMSPEEKNAQVQKIKVDFFKIVRAHNALKKEFERDAKDPVAKWYGLTVGPFSKHLVENKMPKAAFAIAAKMYDHYSGVISPIEVTTIHELPSKFTDEDKKVIRSLNAEEFEKVKKGLPVECMSLTAIAQSRVERFCQEEIKDCEECTKAQKNLAHLNAFFDAMDEIKKSN